MGTTAITQHANLIALFPLSVKGGDVVLPVRFAGRDGLTVEITATRALAETLRDALCAALPPVRKPGKRGPKTPPETIAAYRRVLAAVGKGATWAAAARAEGVDRWKVNAWWHSARRREARRTGKAPVLKPSGEIL